MHGSEGMIGQLQFHWTIGIGIGGDRRGVIISGIHWISIYSTHTTHYPPKKKFQKNKPKKNLQKIRKSHKKSQKIRKVSKSHKKSTKTL